MKKPETKGALKKFWSNKKLRWITIGAIALLTVGAGASYSASAGKSVDAMAASVQELSSSFYEDGIVCAQERSVVSADIGGKVVAVHVKEGQSVKSGDALLEMDTAAIEAEKALLQADRSALMASWEQSRSSAEQQIAALEAQKAGVNTADISRFYETQVLLLEQSMDPSVANSVAWSFKAMMAQTQFRMNETGMSSAERMTLQGQLDSAKAQSAAINNQIKQYDLQAETQLIALREKLAATADPQLQAEYQALIDKMEDPDNSVSASYDEMQRVADAQVQSLQGALGGDGETSAETRMALQSELRALQEQYNQYIYNTQAQVISLMAQQEQAASAQSSARSTRSKLNKQIGLLEESMQDGSGTASYYAAQLERVDAGMQELDRQLALAKVIAPIDGMLGALPVKAGEYLQAGSQITEVVDASVLKVECMLLTEDSSGVYPGMQAELIWECRDGDRTYACEVQEVSSLAVDSVSAVGLSEQRVKVVLLPKFAEGEAFPGDGYRVRVRFTTAKESALAVPKSAVLQTEFGDAVFVLRDGVATLVPVQIGLESGNMIAVRSGLSEFDIVVKDPGATDVREGETVRITQ